jgi:hypothetical protein
VAVKALQELLAKLDKCPRTDRGFHWQASDWHQRENLTAYGEWASALYWIIENQDALVSALSNPPAQPGWRDMERDAERWNALLRCARIRMQGSSGFDPKTGERREYNNATGETEPSDKGWVHFGAEFWSVYPGHEDEDKATRWGTLALIALADDVLLKERQSLPAAPQPKGE